ncbi:DegT/DnrJ/EryC1/StrS family aminotransferase [Streptomyces sp900116325]|uniref:DegT/DnrJ/EryC1/StrS family aminotransferase n=1 Tax=Streptomyces sp. 900116325 TaxID=3154295 RepID=UPI0033EBFC02
MTSKELTIEGGSPAVTRSSPLRWPNIDDEDKQAVMAVLDGPPSDLGGPHSRWNRKLEAAFAEFTGAQNCVSLSSATAALYASLLVHGIGPGDEVIVPGLTWVATAMVVAQLGATPVFCDIDPVTFNIDPEKARALVTPATRAIIVVHAHGLPADMSQLSVLCHQRGLYLIEDAAQAAGATYAGQAAGTFGATGCFSLNYKKAFTAGDGGLLVTDDAALLEAVMSYANFGFEPAPAPAKGETASHWSRWLGTNDRLSPMAAALAHSQLRKLPRFIEVAAENAAVLAKIGEFAGFQPPEIPEDRSSTHHLYRVVIDAEALGWQGPASELRDRIIWALHAEGVTAGYWGRAPLNRMTAFRRTTPRFRTVAPDDHRPALAWEPEALPVTEQVLDTSLVLGRAPETLHIADRERVTQWVHAFAKIADRIDVVMSAPHFRPLRPQPPVPELEDRLVVSP